MVYLFQNFQNKSKLRYKSILFIRKLGKNLFIMNYFYLSDTQISLVFIVWNKFWKSRPSYSRSYFPISHIFNYQEYLFILNQDYTLLN